MSIQIEYMKEEYAVPVSQLLLQGFCTKLQFGTKITDARLQLLLEKMLVLDKQLGKGKRFVAIEGGSIIGSFSIKFQGKWSKQRSNMIKTDVLTYWNEIKALGLANALGFLLRLMCLHHHPRHGEVYISDLAVHEKYQGSGVGKAMLKWAIEEAELQSNNQFVSLHVADSNVRAKHLYERMGFRTLAIQSSILLKWFIGEAKWYYMIYEG